MGTPILDYQAGGGAGGPTPPATGLPQLQSGATALVNGQSYADVVFPNTQIDGNWTPIERGVINTLDASPLNIWPGIITKKSVTGFRQQLNGRPDSSNYYLVWTIQGIVAPSGAATAYLLSGPASGSVGVASTNFTVALPAGSALGSILTVTPSDGGAGGVFTPATALLTTAVSSVAFTYTAASSGAKSIVTTNDKGLTDPAPIIYTAT